MNATFHFAKWEVPSPKYIPQSATKRKPDNAVMIKRQGNKVIYMIAPRARYLLEVKAENGETYQEDMYWFIKEFAPKKQITEKFRNSFEKYMKGQNFSVDERTGEIKDLYNIVQKYFREIEQEKR